MRELILEVTGKYVKLNEEEEGALKSAFGEEKVVRRSEYFYPLNEPCRYIYFINKGIVRHFYVAESGAEITCDFSKAGDFFTDFESFKQNKASNYQFQALEETLYLAIDFKALQQLYAQWPKIESFGRLMAEQIAERVSRMAQSLITEKAETRYVNLLKERPEIFQRVPQKYIAGYLGIKPESLSRLRKTIVAREKRT